MRKKIIAMATTMALVATAFTGCGNSGKDTTAGTESSGKAASGNINIGGSANVTTLDNNVADLPDDLAVIRQMQDSLYEQTATGVELQLAESVDISDDQTTYTFHLRDANYSDGNPIVAGDFVYSWKRLVNPDTGSEYAWFAGAAGIKNADEIAFNGGDINSLGVKAIDDKTLEVELDRAVPYFTNIMTMPAFAPIEEAFGEKQGDQYGLSGENIISSGPFVVDEWVVGGEEIKLKKNEKYWNKDAIEAESLTFKTVKDEQAGVLAYQSGTLDVVPISGDMVAQYQDDKQLDIQSSTMLYYLCPNVTNKYFANKNFRLAWAYGLNRKEIVENILKDGSLEANYWIPANFAADENGVNYREAVSGEYPSYNEEKAKEYWEAAKKELGESKIKVEFLYDDTETSKNVVQYIQSAFKNIFPDLEIELREVPYKSCWDLQKEGDFEITFTSWGADYIDPSIYFDILNSSNQYDLGKWENKEYDELVESATTTYATDHEKRIEVYGQAEQLLLDDGGIMPVYQESRASLIREGISMEFAPNDVYLYRYAKLSK